MTASERSGTDEHTMQFGLLMESAQAHQRLAEMHLEKLKAHTQDLDGVVREEIRRTLVDELQAVMVESERAARALRSVKHAVNMHGLAWNIGIAVLCTLIPTGIAHFSLPSEAHVAALRQQRDELARNLADLERRGGKVDWRSCGAAVRLCIRVDRKAPAYGEQGDFYIVKGY